MTRDKQLRRIELTHLIEKRRLDQALNSKEFAMLAGISYSSARAWFRQPGFPVIRGVVFWSDFVEWRRRETGLANTANERRPSVEPLNATLSGIRFTGKAARILAEAG